MLDPDARWCITCTLLDDVEESAHAATCDDCRASDLNKDEVVADPFFNRLYKAVQYKKAGVPVMELAQTLDDTLAIFAVENEIEKIRQELRAEERENNNGGDLLSIEEIE
tara:strand:- start:81 stop:410 length:330 start_codon:yes stop_codon:yes gene_type:complete